jgi:hypothetical protein
MRVSFVLSIYALGSGTIINSLTSVFGNRIRKYANCNRPLTIECSAERFVKWLIVRNELGAQNSFKDLKLQIIEPEPSPQKLSFD